MSTRGRNIRAGLASFAVIASVVAVASQADGREASQATSNDGGAWLVDRGTGGVAHVEYTTRQPTVHTQISDPGSEVSVLQATNVVAVHDRTASVVKLVDNANATELSSTSIPVGNQVRAVPDGVVIFDPQRSDVWTLSTGELSSAASLEALVPTHRSAAPGRLVVDPSGRHAVVSGEAIAWPADTPDEGEPQQPAEITTLPTAIDSPAVTMAGGRVVVVDGGRWMVGTPGDVRELELARVVEVGRLQQESLSWPRLGLTTGDGRGVVVDLLSGDVIDVGGDLTNRATTDPIFFESCLHSLGGVSGDMLFTAACLDGRTYVQRGLRIGEESELRLVNDEVWIDALDGSGFLLTPELELREIADFTEIFDDTDGEESADGENVEEQLDQSAVDAGLTEADQPDDDPANRPPIANDDEAATRLGRPALVDVLANDSDPDSDVILVEGAEILDGAELARVEVPTSRNGVQITPTGGTGIVTVRYQITDGSPSGQATALVTLEILPPVATDNRPPEAGLDRIVGAAGSVVAFNLLDNDKDPDGDAIVLQRIGDTFGASVLSQHPGGDVLLVLPTNVRDGVIDIAYVVADEWQAETEGLLRVTIRLDESNTPPDARNDAGTTQVGRRITLDLLANDVDGDNDLLSIGQPARPQSDAIDGFYATTDDGEFTFEPTEPGTYVFEYSATDRAEADRALVRIEVTEPVGNRPPIAVRDDVALARGETRLVRALENDGDPDGDLFAVREYSANQNLDLLVEPGVGFHVTMKPGAAPVEIFQYRITDGALTSDLVTVVVTRSDAAFQDAAPVVNDDVARVRAGRTSRIFVLRNDYDPEGGPLQVTETSSGGDVTVVPAPNGQWVEVSVPESTVVPFSVQYTVVDQDGNVGAGSVQLSIVPPEEPNSAPIARPDTAYTIESQPVVIPVLANDSDPESDALALVSIPQAPEGGSVVPTEDGAGYLYTPAPGFRGTDQFAYLVQDSEGAQATGYVEIGVMSKPSQNRPPEAVADLDWQFIAGGGRVTLNVLGNDRDPDGDELVVIEVTGDAILTASGKAVLYDLPPAAGEGSTVSFTYTVADGRGGTDSAEVRFEVLPNIEPVPPEANPDAPPAAKPGTELTVDVLANDIDPDGDDANLVLSEVGAGASVVDNRFVVVVPDESAEYSYTITDEDGLTAASFVTVTVEENLAPEVQSPIVLGEFFSDEQIPVVNLADYVTDPEDDELTFANVSGWIGGQTRLDVDERDARLVTFLPDADYKGTAGFAFTVNDSFGNSSSGRVELILKGLSNQAPVGIDTSISVEAGVDQPLALASLFDDPDVGDTLTFEVTSGPSGPVSISIAGGTATLSVPVTAGAATDQFVVQATDSAGEQGQAVVSVTVTPSTIGPPEPVPDQAETNQGEPVTVDVVANDRNVLPQGELTVINAFVDGRAGSATANGREVTFTPTAEFFGTAQVRYTVKDEREGPGGEAEGILTVDVIGRPGIPSGVEVSSDGPRNVLVQWRIPPDNGAPIEGYKIRVNGSEIRTVNSTTPQFLFTDRTPGTEYLFEVLATNKAGDGNYSTQAGPITPDVVPPVVGKPVVAFALGTPGQLDIGWTEPLGHEGSPITEYQLEIGGECGSQTISVGLSLSHSWTGLTDGDLCTFRVTAINAAGPSPAPSPWSDPECSVGPTSAPAQPTAVRGDKQATVTWSQPSNPGDCQGILGYELLRYRNGGPDDSTEVGFGTTQSTSAPLLNGEKYSFEIRARNRQGWGPVSPRSVEVMPCGVPLAASAPTVTAGDEQVTISHANDAGANGCAVTQYMVRVSPGGDRTFASPITGLTNGTAYTFAIAGVNEIGVGEFGPPSAPVVPAGPPFAPVIMSNVIGGIYHWTIGPNGPNADNGSPITGYQISGHVNPNRGPLAPPGPDGGILECVNTLGNACLPPGGAAKAPPSVCMQNAATLSVSGTATNSVAPSLVTTANLGIQGCPSAPSLTTSAGNAQFTANWSRPPGTDAIYIQIDGNYGSPQGGSSRTWPANNNQTYQIRAWACNEFGCAASGVQPVTPRDPRAVSASWGPVYPNAPGCTGNNCMYIDYSWSGFPANQNVTLACRNDHGWNFRYTVSTGSGSGSGRTTGQCWSDDDFERDIWIEFGGIRSNDLPDIPGR